MGLEHAMIKVITPLSGPGAAALAPFPDGIPVRFNPNEYSLVRNMNYADVNIPGLETSVVQFVRGETQTLALELYLDRSDRVAYRTPPASPTDAVGEGASAVGGASAPTGRTIR